MKMNFFDILGVNGQLIITTFKVYSTENEAVADCVEYLLDIRERVSIPFYDAI